MSKRRISVRQASLWLGLFGTFASLEVVGSGLVNASFTTSTAVSGSVSTATMVAPATLTSLRSGGASSATNLTWSAGGPWCRAM